MTLDDIPLYLDEFLLLIDYFVLSCLMIQSVKIYTTLVSNINVKSNKQIDFFSDILPIIDILFQKFGLNYQIGYYSLMKIFGINNFR